MITALKYSFVMGVIGLIFASPLFPTVEILPYGIDEALIMFVGTIKGFISLFPELFTPIWNVIVWGLIITFLLFLWERIQWLIDLFR